MLKSIIVILLVLASGYKSFSQTSQTIDALDKSYQACLDSGINMLGCSQTYYQQIDNMLNVVYKKLRGSYDSSQQATLKSEQLKWLSDRNKYFKKVDSEPEDGLTGQDKIMAELDKKAEFVKDRVLTLIKRLKQ
jgi:uncharacterized protein YecT (DUF1311 family)